MVRKCREIEIVIKDGNFIHTTHDYFGETCEELLEIIKKFIDSRSLNFRYTEDRDDPRVLIVVGTKTPMNKTERTW